MHVFDNASDGGSGPGLWPDGGAVDVHPAWASPPTSTRHSADSVYNAVVFLLAILIIFANAGGLCYVVARKFIRRPAYHYVASLSAADALLGVFLALTHFVASAAASPDRFKVHCVVRICIITLFCTVSLLSMLGIAVDRYVFLVHAIHYYQRATYRHSIALVAGLWAFSGAVSFLPLMGLRKEGGGEHADCIFYNVAVTGYAVVMIALFITIPFLAIFVVYGRILLLVFRLNERLAEQRQGRQQQQQQGDDRTTHSAGVDLGSNRGRRELNAVKRVAIVVGCFLLTWLPSLAVIFVQFVSGQPGAVNPTIASYSPLVLYVNSLINPCIYIFYGSGGGKSANALKLLCCSPYRCLTDSNTAASISMVCHVTH